VVKNLELRKGQVEQGMVQIGHLFEEVEELLLDQQKKEILIKKLMQKQKDKHYFKFFLKKIEMEKLFL
jgi:hypothetical protein